MVKFEEMDAFFKPDRVAIIGASKSLLGGGGIFLNSLMEMNFPDIIPVNPNEDEILGLKSYPTVKDIPGQVDYAIVAVPARIVPKVIGDCVEKGVKVAHIFTSGFSEIAEEGGKELEDELLRVADGKTRIIGPNCMGIYCPESKLSYLPGSSPDSGSVSLISQSGRYATFILIMTSQFGIKYNKIISVGNSCDLNATDFLEYLGDDPDTKTIAMYAEGVKDGKKFLNVLKEVTKKKPVIIWKGGRTEEGSMAAASHTGSLAGSNLIWESVFKQTGVIQVKSLDEMIDTIAAFNNLPPISGRNVAIITGGGGETVTSADACSDEGLYLKQFSDRTKWELENTLTIPGTIHRNPVDYSSMGSSPGILRKVTKIVVSDDNVDAVIVLLFVGPAILKAMTGSSIVSQFTSGETPDESTMSRLLDQFIKLSINDLIRTNRDIDKPMVVVSPMMDAEPSTVAKLQNAGIPVYPSFERALKAISRFISYHEFLEKS